MKSDHIIQIDSTGLSAFLIGLVRSPCLRAAIKLSVVVTWYWLTTITADAQGLVGAPMEHPYHPGGEVEVGQLAFGYDEARDACWATTVASALVVSIISWQMVRRKKVTVLPALLAFLTIPVIVYFLGGWIFMQFVS